jgi:ATP-dependent RNA helicase DHX29
LPRAATTTEQDKTLLRLFITYSVLAQLGFSEARITQCLLSGLEDNEGWEEASEWMWLHLSEDECLQRGAYAPKEGMSFMRTGRS